MKGLEPDITAGWCANVESAAAAMESGATVQDWLVSISTDTGVGAGLGALGYDFTTSGGTWSDADGTLYAINGGTDGLYTIDPVLVADDEQV